jgi:predicted transposase/invertase (TIGR01784 family)
MSYDNLAKSLSEKYPERFASWLLGSPQVNVEVLKTELSIEPIRADSVTFLRTQSSILHIEFQTRLDSDPPLDFRMLDYWVRLHRLYRIPIIQIVVLLLPPSPETVITNFFQLSTTRHEYQVIKLWDVDPEVLLRDPALLPFAPLASKTPSEALLLQVAAEVDKIESVPLRQEITSCVHIMAGLKYSKTLIQRLFQEDIMQESVTYQDILQKGEDKGLRIGLRREQNLVFRQLTKKVGVVPADVRLAVEALSIERLESLGEELLSFNSLANLRDWLDL